MRLIRLLLLPALILGLFLSVPGVARSGPVHAVALHGQPKYGPDFAHFDYVNPDARKGGELRMAALGGFDTFNPFVLRGQSAAGLGLMFESLTTSSADEPFTEYGLLAETIEISPDRSTVTYRLREQARFHDGSPVTADDVVFSFETLRTRGLPFFRAYYANIEGVEALDPRTVRFNLGADENPELAFITGQMPVLSRAYWSDRDFEATTLEVPVGSGPYRIERFEPGRFVVYRRVEDYWGQDLPVNRGQYNFDRIRYDYYRDGTVAFEAFKAGSYDVRPENVARQWATGYDFPAARDGRVVLEEFRHTRPVGMQAFAVNLRRPQFQDARIRQALNLAFDFEWSNQNLFHDQYVRTRSFFENSELAATGLPGALELEVLEPLRELIPPEVFTDEYRPPSTAAPGSLRENLHRAVELLQAAGWTFLDRRLVNAASGEPFRMEILLVDPSFERIALPYSKNLERLGMDVRVRTVDAAQYENRVKSFDFDMIVNTWGQSESPGNEQREFWGSVAADAEGSRNVSGIRDPAVDALIEALIRAPDRESLVARVRALDRVLQWNHYVIPQWHINTDRIAYWNRFGHPDVTPDRGVQLLAWWHEPDRAASGGRDGG